LLNNFKKIDFKIFPVIKNYQYIDKHTVLGYIYFYSLELENIIQIEKKYSKFLSYFFIISEKNISKIYGPVSNSIVQIGKEKNQTKKYDILKNSYNQLNHIQKKNEKTNIKLEKIAYMPTQFDNFIVSLQNSNLKLKKDRYCYYLQHLEAICLPTNTILNYVENNFVEKKKLFATLVHYTQQTDDIVQGLPKIEELIEARKPKKKRFYRKNLEFV
jgi:hypothetical protein